jgi:HEAT repeat protein
MTTQQPVKNKVAFACVIFSLIVFCGCESNLQNQRTDKNTAESFVSNDLEMQAARIIQQGLSSTNPQIRANAIEIAAGTGKQQFMSDILRLTNDDLVPIRFAAAVAIGESKYSAGKNSVAQLLKDSDENVRLAADYALVMLGGSKSYTEQIRKAMASDDQQVRANAAFLLGKIGDKKALPLLHQAIRDEASDDRVRLNAIEAIARLGDETIYQKLWAMLISAYADDRVFGIRAMGALGTPQTKDVISTMLKDNLPGVRLVAAEELGNMGDIAGEKIVADALTKDLAATQDQETKVQIQTLAALAIGQIRTPALKKFLPELLKSDSQFARLAAAKAVFQCASRNNIGR